MKKIILYVLVFLCFISLPIVKVKADDAPAIATLYDAVVTNPNGARVWCVERGYEDYFYISYGSTITIVSASGPIGTVFKYNGDLCSISKDDIGLKSKEYSLSNATKLDSKEKAITRRSLKMYKGPAEIFEEVGEIPQYEELEYQYVIDDEEGHHDWIYVSYNGKSGWVVTLAYEGVTVGFPSTRYAVIKNDVEGEEESTSPIKVPTGTVLKCLYDTPWKYGDACIAKYNNQFVYVEGYYNQLLSAEEATELLYDLFVENGNDEPIEDKKEEIPVIDVKQDKKDYYNLIFVAIGAAGLVALTAGITLLIVNKKNKKENN